MLPKIKFKTCFNNITHIEIDGQEIQGVQRAEVLYEVNELPVVRLVMQAESVDVDAVNARIEGQMKMDLGGA